MSYPWTLERVQDRQMLLAVPGPRPPTPAQHGMNRRRFSNEDRRIVFEVERHQSARWALSWGSARVGRDWGGSSETDVAPSYGKEYSDTTDYGGVVSAQARGKEANYGPALFLRG